MLYRKMNNVGSELSILGFGCMRLPIMESGNIDEKQATEMLRYAIDRGVNYVDTAYPYHKGSGEPFVGRALRDGYRERVNLATKLPSWLVNSRQDMDRYLEEQLLRLQTDHIDFYLVHGFMRCLWEKLQPLGIIEFLDDAIDNGKIRYAGFSFHDEVGLFKEIVDAYNWTFCQIQYNFMDEKFQAGTEGLVYAADKGLGIIVMEPLRGGMLAKEIPAISKIWEKAAIKQSPSEWALRWVWNHPEITVVLSGMSSQEQVKQNIAYAEGGFPNTLTQYDLSLFEEVKAEYKNRIEIPCTGCKYCLPCPSGVNIPECFAAYNVAHIYESPGMAKYNYNMSLSGYASGHTEYASQCKECGICDEICPQGIQVRDNLKKVAEYFGK